MRALFAGPGIERNIPLYYLYSFLRDFQVWIPVWIVFLMLDQGFSLTEVTGAEALFLVGVVALEVPTGAVADRWGRSLSLGLGAAFLAVAIAVFALTRSFPVLLTSFLIWSVATALMSGADLALLFDSLKKLGRDHEYERIAGTGSALHWAGAATAMLFGGPIAAAWGKETTIWVGVGTTALCALAGFAMVEAGHRSAEHHGTLLGDTAKAARSVFVNPAVRWVLLFSAALMATIGTSGYLVQPYLVARDVEVGLLFSLLQVPHMLGGALGSLLAYRAVRLLGESGSLVGAGAAGLGGFVAIALVDSLGAFAVIPLFALLEALILPAATGFINRRVDSGQRATVLSMHSFFVSMITAPLVILVGVASDANGPRWAFGFIGTVLAVVFVAGTTVWLGRVRGRPGAPGRLAVEEGV